MRREIRKRFCGANVKGQTGRTVGKWENNNEMELKEIRWGGGRELDSTGSRQGQIAGSCEKGNEVLGTLRVS